MIQRRLFHRLLQPFSSGTTGGSRCVMFGLHSAMKDRHTSSPPSSSSSTTQSTLPVRATEHTLIAVKPDGVQRRLVGQIIHRFEQRGFKLVGLKMMQASEDLLSEHYREIVKKPFYPLVRAYMTAGPVIVMVRPHYLLTRLFISKIHWCIFKGVTNQLFGFLEVWEGSNVVQSSRKMVGPTNGAEAQAGTIRGDFSFHVGRNVVHASDSTEGAQREIGLWFQENELLNWESCDQDWTIEANEDKQ
ncbi:nucleoside diphosphate kinase, mitochondrial isoform X1 [Gouania willdenowi]|uniref:nucleoside diphosphate kinase, mitochondrial isoform X1 n=1 Tax=Gouania willdenowi TaxID=441366 RepID=UPI001056CFE3|nr:nucleoside diphosphate kinase, mitochondrial-like isoform X1 [Gouania willdenowi]